MQLGGVLIDAEGAGREQLVLSVPAALEPDAEHARPAGGQKVPDRVADDVAVGRLDAQRLLAGEEQVRLGLGASTSPRSITTVSAADTERRE